MFILLLSLLGNFAYSKNYDKFLREKTYPRLTNICYVDSKRLEITLRGINFTNDPYEIKFGEYLFYTIDNNDDETDTRHYQIFPINSDHNHTYSMFESKNEYCDKSPVYKLNEHLLAIPILRENSPGPTQLSIQLFDLKKMKPAKVIETYYATNTLENHKNGFSFNHIYEKHEIRQGKVTINQVEYSYHDQDFLYWMNYTKNGFAISAIKSYEKFEWKHFFKDIKDFKKAADWDKNQKYFKNSFLYHAINHKDKKECIHFAFERRPIKGTEQWYCGQLI